MALNPNQFGMKVHTNKIKGETTVVAYQHPDGGKVTGAASVQHGDWAEQAQQRRINAGQLHHDHDVREVGQERTDLMRNANAGQIPGQQHWGGGALNPSGPDYISWLHTDRKAALKPMLGALVDKRGRGLPVADATLTEAGARFSQSMGRKIGIQGHPDNPHMEPTIEADELTVSDAQRITAYKAQQMDYEGPLPARQHVRERAIQTANAIASRAVSAEQFKGPQLDERGQIPGQQSLF